MKAGVLVSQPSAISAAIPVKAAISGTLRARWFLAQYAPSRVPNKNESRVARMNIASSKGRLNLRKYDATANDGASVQRALVTVSQPRSSLHLPHTRTYNRRDQIMVLAPTRKAQLLGDSGRSG